MPTAAPAAVVPKTLRDDLLSSRVPWHAALSDDPQWVDVTELLTVDKWQHLAADYQQSCGFAQTTPAAACALQHYAGRYAGTAITTWSVSSLILPSQHNQWKVLIDTDGATHHVYCKTLPEPQSFNNFQRHREQQSAGVLAHSLVEHFEPIVDACRTANQITARLAWGCIAASCAGVFGQVYRSVDVTERRNVVAAAAITIETIEAQVDRQLISWLDAAPSNRLLHDRHTCCLMRLGHNKQACVSCPDISAQERSTRRSNAISAAALPPLHWAGQL